MNISIVIPLYNKEATIARAVTSVLHQTHQNFELIIVDDGSTDSSSEIAHTFDDLRITIITQPNKGVSAARNEGVRCAAYDWVAFLDADDEYMPTFLEKVIYFITSHSDRQLSFVSGNIIYGHTGLQAFSDVDSAVYNYFDLCDCYQTPATSSSTAVRREAFIEVGGFPEGTRQFEDWTLWCKLAWIGEFGFIGEPLSLYHYTTTGSASTREYSAAEYFSDVATIPLTAHTWMHDGKIPENALRDSWKYVNSYLLGHAYVLRQKGDRWLALKLLGEINGRYLDSASIRICLWFLILLFLPLGMGRAVKRLRTGIRSKCEA